MEAINTLLNSMNNVWFYNEMPNTSDNVQNRVDEELVYAIRPIGMSAVEYLVKQNLKQQQ